MGEKKKGREGVYAAEGTWKKVEMVNIKWGKLWEVEEERKKGIFEWETERSGSKEWGVM